MTSVHILVFIKRRQTQSSFFFLKVCQVFFECKNYLHFVQEAIISQVSCKWVYILERCSKISIWLLPTLNLPFPSLFGHISSILRLILHRYLMYRSSTELWFPLQNPSLYTLCQTLLPVQTLDKFPHLLSMFLLFAQEHCQCYSLQGQALTGWLYFSSFFIPCLTSPCFTHMTSSPLR